MGREKDSHLKGSFAPWILLGTWHAVVVFFACILYAEYNASTVCGSGMDRIYFGDQLGGATVAVVNIKILIESRYWNWQVITFI